MWRAYHWCRVEVHLHLEIDCPMRNLSTQGMLAMCGVYSYIKQVPGLCSVRSSEKKFYSHRQGHTFFPWKMKRMNRRDTF